MDSREPPAFHTFGPESILKRNSEGGQARSKAAPLQALRALLRTRTSMIWNGELRTPNTEGSTVNLKTWHPVDM